MRGAKGKWDSSGREERNVSEECGVRVRISSMARFQKGHSEEKDGVKDWNHWTAEQYDKLRARCPGTLEAVFTQPVASSLSRSLEPSIIISH